MRSRYKEIGKKVPQAYLRYVEDTFLPCDAVDALRFAKATDLDGKQTRYSYTERGLLKTIGTDEGTISYTYDGAGRVVEQTAYTEANGHSYRTRYRYDGRTVTEERGAYITTYALDGWGNPIRKTDGEGWSERYRYDATRRLYVHVQPSCPVLQNAKLGTA